VDNHIITGDPVDRGGDLVLITSLEGVDDTENLGSVATSGGGVGQDQTDGLLGVNDEDGADGKGDALGVHVGGILVVQPRRDIIRCCVLVIKAGEYRKRKDNEGGRLP
jgi:hypothetical protein